MIPTLLSLSLLSSDIPSKVCNDLAGQINATAKYNIVYATPINGATYGTFIGCDLIGEKKQLDKAVKILNSNQIINLRFGYSVNSFEHTIRRTVFVYVNNLPKD